MPKGKTSKKKSKKKEEKKIQSNQDFFLFCKFSLSLKAGISYIKRERGKLDTYIYDVHGDIHLLPYTVFQIFILGGQLTQKI